jgi:hypothetical protein
MFKTNLYEVVREAVSPDLLSNLDTQFELIKKLEYLRTGKDESDLYAFADTQISKSFSYYSALPFEALSLQLQSLMEEVTGKSLYPSYTYARIYYNGAEMAEHKDRPSCEYSCTLNISIDEKPWEIWFEDLEKKRFSINLYPGDLIVYKGDILNHWRLPYEGKRQTQAFLHYVDKNGNHRDYKWDRRPYIGLAPTTRL